MSKAEDRFPAEKFKALSQPIIDEARFNISTKVVVP